MWIYLEQRIKKETAKRFNLKNDLTLNKIVFREKSERCVFPFLPSRISGDARFHFLPSRRCKFTFVLFVDTAEGLFLDLLSLLILKFNFCVCFITSIYGELGLMNLSLCFWISIV